MPELLRWEWKFSHILLDLAMLMGQVWSGCLCLVRIPYLEAFQTDNSVAEDSDALKAFQRDCHEIKVRRCRVLFLDLESLRFVLAFHT